MYYLEFNIKVKGSFLLSMATFLNFIVIDSKLCTGFRTCSKFESAGSKISTTRRISTTA